MTRKPEHDTAPPEQTGPPEQTVSTPPRRLARVMAAPSRIVRPRGWGLVLLAAGLWTMLGAVPGLVDPETAYQHFHGGPATRDALELFRGASGQTFLFAVGYLVAAFAPRRHALVVALGGAGKAMYAARLLSHAAAGPAAPLTLVAAVGDLVFVGAFVVFLAHTAGSGVSGRSRLSVGFASLLLGVGNAMGNGRPDHPIQDSDTQQPQQH